MNKNILHFEKYHGLGNDFIIIDCRNHPLHISNQLARKLCDRHYGIGADGFIQLLRSKNPVYICYINMFNSDGSSCEMCGNASRCVTKYLHSKFEIPNPILLDTSSGMITCNVSDEDIVPHCVIFIDDDLFSVKIEEMGRRIQNMYSLFPNGVNVDFVKIITKQKITIRIYERGVGETNACGTGACASSIAAILEKGCVSPVAVDMKGGTLQTEYNKIDNSLSMIGSLNSANWVYSGLIEFDNVKMEEKKSSFDDNGVISKISGHEILSLVSTTGSTPCYVYDLKVVQKQIKKLRDAFKSDNNVIICYAQKANPNTDILNLILSNSLYIDAVSAGEIFRAITLGFPSESIIFVCDIFSKEALELCLKFNIYVCCGSIDMIEQYGRATLESKNSKKRKEIMIRINPGFGHGHGEKTNTGGPDSKHGIWFNLIEKALEIARKYDLKINGIHMHIGSGSDFDHLTRVCKTMKNFAPQLPDLEFIDIGGGLPVKYHPEDEEFDVERYAECWLNTLDVISEKIKRKLTLITEPGRYIVGEAGFIISEIRCIKNQGDEDHLYYLVDCGFTHLIRPVLYNAYHHISVCLHKTDNAKIMPASVTVAGPLCESGDILTEGKKFPRLLPKAEVGDFIVIHCVGAYGQSMQSNYNSMPFANEVIIGIDDMIKLGCKAQSLMSLIR